MVSTAIQRDKPSAVAASPSPGGRPPVGAPLVGALGRRGCNADVVPASPSPGGRPPVGAPLVGALGRRGCNGDVVPAPQPRRAATRAAPTGDWASWVCGVVSTAIQQDKSSQGIGHRGGVGWLVPRRSGISRRRGLGIVGVRRVGGKRNRGPCGAPGLVAICGSPAGGYKSRPYGVLS